MNFARNRPGARPEGYPGAGSEAELVGIARIRPEWVYEGFECFLPNLIVIGNAMDHARLSRVPSSAEDPEGQLEVCDQYNRGARVVNPSLAQGPARRHPMTTKRTPHVPATHLVRVPRAAYDARRWRGTR